MRFLLAATLFLSPVLTAFPATPSGGGEVPLRCRELITHLESLSPSEIRNYAGPEDKLDETISARRAFWRNFILGYGRQGSHRLFARALELPQMASLWETLEEVGYKLNVLTPKSIEGIPTVPYFLDTKNRVIAFNPFQVEFDPDGLFVHAVVRATVQRKLESLKARQKIDVHLSATTDYRLRELVQLAESWEASDRTEDDGGIALMAADINAKYFSSYDNVLQGAVSFIIAEYAAFHAYVRWREPFPEVRQNRREAMFEGLSERGSVDHIVAVLIGDALGLMTEDVGEITKAIQVSGIKLEMGLDRLTAGWE